MQIVSFWFGVITGPFLLLALFGVFRMGSKLYREYFRGIGILSWPGMWLVIIGLKLVRKKHLRTFQGMDRFWVSPNVEAFVKKPS